MYEDGPHTEKDNYTREIKVKLKISCAISQQAQHCLSMLPSPLERNNWHFSPLEIFAAQLQVGENYICTIWNQNIRQKSKFIVHFPFKYKGFKRLDVIINSGSTPLTRQLIWIDVQN